MPTCSSFIDAYFSSWVSCLSVEKKIALNYDAVRDEKEQYF